MKLSTKSRYALRCMVYLAGSEQTVSIADISQNQNISERYLELIFAKLKKASLIESVRGSRGGYKLSKPSKNITVYDIVHTMESNASIVKKKDSIDPMSQMLTREIWNPIDHKLEVYLKGITLHSLLK